MDTSGLVTEETDENRLYGVYPGYVSDNDDPEKMARVKVKFPWRDAKDESVWARIATPMAGKKMGAYFIPEKGDEVLVAFYEGDIHEPYVVGSLWNGKQKPPQKKPKNKNPTRQIVSVAGHKITFDDTKKKGKLELETGKKQKVTVDDKNEKITVKDKHGNEIETSKKGVTVKSKKDLNLEGKTVNIEGKKAVNVNGKQIKIEGKAKTQVSSKGQLNIDTKGMLNVKAKGMLNVKTSGILKMQGSMIMLN